MRTTTPFFALIVGACASTSLRPMREFPLVAGGSTTAAVRRVDVNERVWGPPDLAFEVECIGLDYAKGEERDFCYRWGSWFVLPLEHGMLVACNIGEFGGFVLWYSKRGELLQTLIASECPQTLISDGEALVCVTGLSHLTMSHGTLEAFRLVGSRWQWVGSTKLAREAACVAIEPDGGLLVELGSEAGLFRYRAGDLERLPSLSPKATRKSSRTLGGVRG